MIVWSKISGAADKTKSIRTDSVLPVSSSQTTEFQKRQHERNVSFAQEMVPVTSPHRLSASVSSSLSALALESSVESQPLLVRNRPNEQAMSADTTKPSYGSVF